MLGSLVAVTFLLQISLGSWDLYHPDARMGGSLPPFVIKLLLTSQTWEHSACLPRGTSITVQSSDSLYGREKKANSKERPKSFPGSRGALRISIMGCGKWVLLILSSLFRVKWWHFCSCLSSASVLSRFGSNSFRSSISSSSPLSTSSLHPWNTVTPSRSLMLLYKVDAGARITGQSGPFGQKGSLGGSSGKSLDPRSFLWFWPRVWGPSSHGPLANPDLLKFTHIFCCLHHWEVLL